MKMLKKNQVVIYVIALMLVVAGYLNYTSTNDFSAAIQASSSEEELAKMANLGDAQLVSSNILNEDSSAQDNLTSSNNAIVENNTVNENETITTNSEVSKNNVDYFSTSKLERDTMYSQMLETYTNVLNSSNSLETQKQSAQEEITKINNTKNSIMICENLIKTKGFENIIIFVNGDSISIIVEDEQLSPEEVAQIQNIISREMNAKIENIHISNK
ncbi:MAG: SpoIIIAH-like family protein [Clostridia bacterium]|nr:SpoIIIAH-like family protein [Clostridia bacterium]